MTPDAPSDPPAFPAAAHEPARRHGARAADVTHAVATPEPLPSAEGQAARASALAAADPSAPLAELARAFQANAQALQGVGTLQSELLAALKRGERSELVLASAQALNESFKQLGTIQRALLARLEAPVQVPGGRLVPLLLLGLAGVVVLATFAIVSTWRDYVEAQPDVRTISEHAAQLMQAGREDAARGAREEAQRLQSRAAESDERVRSLQARLDAEREESVARQRDLSSKEAELDALRRQAVAAQNEALKMISLEGEVRELTAQLALTEPRGRALSEELETARRENARLRRRIASSEMGLEEDPEPPLHVPTPGPAPTPPRPAALPRALVPPGVTPPAAAAAPRGTAPVPPPAAPSPGPVRPPAAAPSGAASGGEVDAPLPPVRGASAPTPAPGPTPAPAASAAPAVAPREQEGTRDPAILGQVQSSLNTLLEASRGKRAEHWQIRRLDGVTQDRLRGVLAERLDAAGRVVEVVEAREAFVWVERDARRALIEFRQGVRSIHGVRSEFHDGSLQNVVAEGEHVALFSQSGLRMIGAR